MTYRRKFVSTRQGGPRPRRGGIRDVINNFAGSRHWLITVMVYQHQQGLVVRKPVDDTHGITCSLCDS